MHVIKPKISNKRGQDNVPLINMQYSHSISLPITPPSTPSVCIQIEPNSTNQNRSTHDSGVHLRAQLRFFFMSPCWKWHLKRQFPWKAWFQFIKIIIVTTQLILFGFERETYVTFVTDSHITFHHYFIQNWDLSFETLPYPRATGDFAIFTKWDLFGSMNYAVQRFNNLTHMSVGLFDYDRRNRSESDEHPKGRMATLHINRFKSCQTDVGALSYSLDTEINEEKYSIIPSDDFDIEQYLLTVHNETIRFCGLNRLILEFNINAIQLKDNDLFSLPDCYHFLVKVVFDNDARSGKIRQRLESESIFEYCTSKDLNGNSTSANSHRNLLIFFDTLVLFVTLISFLLCVRSLYVGHKLCREVRRYFARERPQEPRFSFDELQVFYSFWYFLMIITDLMIIPGTIVKILILFKQTHGYDTAGLLLGTSSLFSWFGILRYLTFFRKYNLLFVTIRRALPLLLRFLLCTIIMYLGFLFGGWIVLGPYHSKFRTLASTFETMFALINGDDMYPTFANIETNSYYIWIFSELYMYSFICLFVYVISSLVITLIIDGYDVVKKYYAEGFPKSRLQKFSEEDASFWSGTQEWQDLTVAIESRSVCFPCCFRTPKELSDLIARDTYLAENAHAFN